MIEKNTFITIIFVFVVIIAFSFIITATPSAPSSVILNTSPTNNWGTDENLTAYSSGIADGSDTVTTHYRWLKNNLPTASMYFPFDYYNITGNNYTHDFSGNDLHANSSWIRDMYPNYVSSGCIVGGCYLFNGLGDTMTIKGFDYHTYGNLSFSVWYKSTNTAASDDETIWSHLTTATVAEGNGTYFSIGDGTDQDQFRFSIILNGQQQDYKALPDVEDKLWHHLGVIRNSTNITIWVDGKQNASYADKNASYSYIVNNNPTYAQDQVAIGNIPQNTEELDGYIDELQFWDYAISPDQMRAIYNAGVGLYNVTVAQETTDGENWSVCAFGINSSGTNGSAACSNKVTIGQSPEVISVAYSSCGGHCNDFWVDYTPTDTGGDVMNCSLYLNTTTSFYLNSTNFTLTSGQQYRIHTNGSAPEGDYKWFINCTDHDGSTNTSVNYMTIDLTNPVIYWYNPLKTNSSFGNYNLSGTHISNISCQDTYVWKMNVSLFSDAALTNHIASCYAADANNLTNWVNITCSLNFTSSGKYFIEASCTDDHTAKNISDDYKKGKKGETTLVFNETESGASLEVTAWFVEKGDKLTDTPGDFECDAYLSNDSSKWKMWYNFTPIKPETKLMLNLTVFNGGLWYRGNLTNITGHFVWGKDSYYDALNLPPNTSFEVVVVNPNSATLKIKGYPGDWDVNEPVFIDPVSGGTNTQTEVSTYYYDQDKPYHDNLGNNATTGIIFGNDVKWNVTLKDNFNLSYYIFSSNITGTWVNDSPVFIGVNYSEASAVKTLNLFGNVSVCSKFFFNDSVGFVNETVNSCFTKNGTYPSFTNPINGSVNFVKWSNFTANITINDIEGLNFSWFSTNASGVWANDTPVGLGGFTQFIFNNSANISVGYPNVTCWKVYANNTVGFINESSTYCFNVSLTDSCTVPNPPAQWNIVDDCVLTTVEDIQPYALNISFTGSLNITATGSIKVSKVYVYPNSSKEWRLLTYGKNLYVYPV